MDSNQEVFDSVADSYVDLALMPPERQLLGRFRERLSELDMLDIGVGTGRTGWTFAPLVRRYVGIDYSPRMIAAARRLLGDDPSVELLVGDARDLGAVAGEFDLVLFSFNGIDASSPEDRLRILAQVRTVLRPGGHFLFSTHSLGTLPFETRRPLSPQLARLRAYRLYASLAGLRYAARIRRINRGLDLAAARRRGWAVVPSMSHGFRIHDYYVDPEFQLAQLRDAGFSVEAIFAPDGVEVSLPHAGREPWFDYLCVAS